MDDPPLFKPFWTGESGILELPHSALENVLSFVPPGFDRKLHVKFPATRLPVCELCKNTFKTRDMCRVRNCHTDRPWSTSYICIFLDGSCVVDARARGGSPADTYVDEPLVARTVPHLDFIMGRPFRDANCPVCAACKKTNRTRCSCREKQMHGELPWNSIYAILSTDNAAVKVDHKCLSPLSEKLPQPSPPNDDQDNPKSGQDPVAASTCSTSTVYPFSCLQEDQDFPTRKGKNAPSAPTEKPSSSQTDFFESDDIYDIKESRAFLVKIGKEHISLQWLEVPCRDIHTSMNQKRKWNNQMESFEHQYDSNKARDNPLSSSPLCSRTNTFHTNAPASLYQIEQEPTHMTTPIHQESLQTPPQQITTPTTTTTQSLLLQQQQQNPTLTHLAARQFIERSRVQALLLQHQHLLQQQQRRQQQAAHSRGRAVSSDVHDFLVNNAALRTMLLRSSGADTGARQHGGTNTGTLVHPPTGSHHSPLLRLIAQGNSLLRALQLPPPAPAASAGPRLLSSRHGAFRAPPVQDDGSTNCEQGCSPLLDTHYSTIQQQLNLLQQLKQQLESQKNDSSSEQPQLQK